MLCMTSVSSTIPVVHVTIDGQTANLPDSNRVLNTGGVDSAGCPDTGFVAVRREESVPRDRVELALRVSACRLAPRKITRCVFVLDIREIRSN